MKKTLEHLWFSYLMERPLPHDAEEHQLAAALARQEDALHAALDETQRELLKNYENYVDKLHIISERDAFIKGVKFASQYLIDVFS